MRPPLVFCRRSQLLPALQPVMEGARGPLLAALLAGSATLARLMTQCEGEFFFDKIFLTKSLT